jgi:hypothetical protein
MALDAAGERQLHQGDLHAADGKPGAAHERIDVDRRRTERGGNAVAVSPDRGGGARVAPASSWCGRASVRSAPIAGLSARHWVSPDEQLFVPPRGSSGWPGWRTPRALLGSQTRGHEA